MSNLSSLITQTLNSSAPGINLATSPNESSVWTATTITKSTTTTASELPLGPAIPTATKFSLAAGAGSAYMDFDCPNALLNTKLSIGWFAKASAGFTSTITITLQSFASSVNRTAGTSPTSVTLQTSTVQGLSSSFFTSFDTNSQLYYRFTINFTGQVGAYYAISQFQVSPGTVTQGAAVGAWESTNSYTIGNGTVGSGATYYRNTFRDADWAEITWEFTQTNAGSAGSGTYTLPMPSGLTIDTTRAKVLNNTTSDKYLGDGILQQNTTVYAAKVLYESSTTVSLQLFNETQAFGSWGSALVSLGNTSITFRVTARIPIAEWAGSGTLNLGAGAQVEYAYNTDTTDADNNTAFAYGQVGGIFGSYTAVRRKRIQWQYPQQAGDRLELQVSQDSGATWTPVGQNSLVQGYEQQNTASYGMTINYISATQAEVQFGQYRANNASTFGGAGVAWSGIAGNSVFRWRIVKHTSSAPVGFGRATATDTGLGYKSRYQAKASGSNVVGTGSEVTVSALAFNNLTLGKTYRISGAALMQQTSANGGATLAIYNNPTVGTNVITRSAISSATAADISGIQGISSVFTATSTSISVGFTGSTGTTLRSDGSRSQTYLILEELDSELTTAWL